MVVSEPDAGGEAAPQPERGPTPAGQEKSSAATSPEKSARVAAAQAFAGKQWEAEQENARRLATRSNGILTTVAALSGLGFFKVGSVGLIEPAWVSWTVRSFLTFSVVVTAIGVVFVLDLRPPVAVANERCWRVRRKFLRWLRRLGADDGIAGLGGTMKRAPFASAYLFSSLPGSEEAVESPDLLRLRQPDLERVAYYRVAQAAVDLHVRNISRRSALMVGQHWLFNGACLAFLAVLTYIVFASSHRGG